MLLNPRMGEIRPTVGERNRRLAVERNGVDEIALGGPNRIDDYEPFLRLGIGSDGLERGVVDDADAAAPHLLEVDRHLTERIKTAGVTAIGPWPLGGRSVGASQEAKAALVVETLSDLVALLGGAGAASQQGSMALWATHGPVITVTKPFTADVSGSTNVRAIP